MISNFTPETMHRPTTSSGRGPPVPLQPMDFPDPKLLKIHLRYHPPGLLLEYLDETGNRKEKTLDLLDLTIGSNVCKVVDEVLNSEPLFCTLKHRTKCMQAVEKLQQCQFHNYAKRYVQWQVIKATSLPMTGAAFSKDGQKVATSCLGNACKVWNAVNGREMTTLVGHEDSVTSINFNAQGDLILTSSDDGTLRQWRLDGDMLLSCKNVLTTVTSTPARGRGGGRGGSTKVKNTTSTSCSGGGRVLFGKYSPDNQKSLCATDDKMACVHDLVQGALLFKFCPDLSSAQEVTSLNLNNCGNLLLTSPHGPGGAALFDFRSGELAATLQSHTMEVTKSIFTFDGSTIATSSWDCTVKLWDFRMLDEPWITLRDSDSEILDIEFDPCGKCLVGGSANGNIYLWEVTCPGDPHLRFEKEMQSSPLSRVGWSTNGALILGANDIGSVCLWHAELGTCLQSLPDHTREIVGAAFSYDSQLIMTASKDKTVRIYKHTLT